MPCGAGRETRPLQKFCLNVGLATGGYGIRPYGNWVFNVNLRNISNSEFRIPNLFSRFVKECLNFVGGFFVDKGNDNGKEN